MRVRVRACACACMRVRACVCVCVCICVALFLIQQPEESAGVGLNPIVPGIGIVQTETTSVVGRPETGISNPAPCAHCSKEIRKMAVNRMISNMDFGKYWPL